MDMLERREGGIRPEVAETIWDLCYQVTPTAFHDEQRHKRRWQDRRLGEVLLGGMKEWQRPALVELCSVEMGGSKQPSLFYS